MDGVDRLISTFAKNSGIFTFNKQDGISMSDEARAKSERINRTQLLKSWRLSPKGWKIYESGKGWRDWQGDFSAKNIHIGNIVHARDINYTDLSIDALNSPINRPSNTQTKQSKIVGILKFISEIIFKILIPLIVMFLAAYFGLKS